MNSNNNRSYTIDGKPVRKFLFARYLVTVQSYTLCMVEAFNKDHAIQRLIQHHVGTSARDWEFMDECAPEHWISRKLGTTLELLPVVHRS